MRLGRFQLREDGNDITKITLRQMLSLFEKWKRRLTYYLEQDVIKLIEVAKNDLNSLRDDGTLTRLQRHLDFLKTHNIDRLKRKKSRYVEQQLNTELYGELSYDLTGIATVFKAVEWLRITYDQLVESKYGSGLSLFRQVLNSRDDLRRVEQKMLTLGIGRLFQCISSGKEANNLGMSFEQSIKDAQGIILKALEDAGLGYGAERVGFGLHLYRRPADERPEHLREVDIAVFDADNKLVMWGEIKSNVFDVRYKAKMQFYKFLQTFRNPCPRCHNAHRNPCTCEVYFENNRGERCVVRADWFYDPLELACEHAIIISQGPLRRVPVPSDIGYLIIPAFLNYVTGIRNDHVLRRIVRSVNRAMSVYLDYRNKPDPEILIARKINNEQKTE